jgi:hypothetical protein
LSAGARALLALCFSRCFFGVLVVGALSGCHDCHDAARSCRFGVDHVLHESDSAELDDLLLLGRKETALAIFSDASGLYGRELDAEGLPRARATRLGERCDAGLAAAGGNGRVWLACARRGSGAEGEPGAVILFELQDAHAPIERARFGPVGSQSHGVSLLVQRGAVGVAWQDAAMGGARIWYASSVRGEPVLLSDPTWYASAPGLHAQGDRVLALFAESQEKARAFESRVRLLEDPGAQPPAAARTVAQTQDGTPSPDLVASQDGLWLAFRDRRKGRKKSGLYLSRLTAQGRQVGAAVRVGRADGVGRPLLRACLGGLVAATPRTFAGDYFVGVVHVDPRASQPSLEQQFYEDSHEFAQVAASCLEARMLLLIAERSQPGSGRRAALRSVGFTCR